MKAIILATAFLLTAAFPVFSQNVDPSGGSEGKQQEEEQKRYFYQWTDSKGVVHIADELGKVPEKYRSRAKKLESSGEDAGSAASQPVYVHPPDFRTEGDSEQVQKDEWQRRMREARQQLADAERRYAEVKRRRDEALEKWGGVAALESGHLEGRQEAERLGQELKQAEQEVSSARNELEVVIPDEARRAGIPPGWLRE